MGAARTLYNPADMLAAAPRSAICLERHVHLSMANFHWDLPAEGPRTKPQTDEELDEAENLHLFGSSASEAGAALSPEAGAAVGPASEQPPARSTRSSSDVSPSSASSSSSD